MRVAGKRTDVDWCAFRARLTTAPTPSLWATAFRRFYRSRIDTRYLRPMSAIKRQDRQLGEGFAIVALFCTLIEYLESCERGYNFHLVGRTGYKLQQHEYSERQAAGYFKDFLRSPGSILESTSGSFLASGEVPSVRRTLEAQGPQLTRGGVS